MEQDHYIEWNIIARKLKGTLDVAGEEEWRRWLDASTAHRAYFEKAKRMWEEPGCEGDVDLDRLIARFDEFAGRTTPVRTWRRKVVFVRYAAIMVLLLCAGGGLLMRKQIISKQSGPQVAEKQQTEILPGSSRASIILADGKQLDLESVGQQEMVCEEQGTAIRMKKGIIAYEAEGTADEEVYNTIVIPRGGEYKLVLPDGTGVWLNSRSRLHFPVNFVGDRRVVELEGEAYFEVTKDRKRPFIVRTAAADVRVYGTAFNVRAYPEEQLQHMTLAEGKVGVLREGKEYRLTPGQQLCIDRDNERVSIGKVNPDLYCSWHKGLLLFENQRLEDIMMRLADWYDVEIVFADETLKELHFTGDLERYADFKDILSLIGMTTSVEFQVAGRMVTVSATKK